MAFSMREDHLEDGRTRVVAVHGDLDIFTAPELRARLEERARQDDGDLVVDFSNGSFVDSSGARVLLQAARRLRAHDGRLIVVNRDEEIARIMSVMGLEDLLTVVASRADAERTLGE
jgi:anti-sigma B factor antagonist